MIQQVSSTLDWPSLVSASPELARFAEEAVEAASHGWRGWPAWVRGYTDFAFACERAAKVLGVPFGDVRRVAMTHLERVHRASLLPRCRR